MCFCFQLNFLLLKFLIQNSKRQQFLNKFSYEVPVTYVGDLKHSRVFSSGRELLTKLGFKVGVFSNEELLPSNLDNLCVFNSWEEVVENSGSVELLRVQKERIENIEGFDFNNYKKNFQLTNEILENTSDDSKKDPLAEEEVQDD